MASEAQIEQRQQAARTHGMYALRDRGEDAMTPNQRSRLQELKELFSSEPGRVEYRRELAAFCALLVEVGMGNIREGVESGLNVWEMSPTKNIAVFMNSLIRLLDNWPKESKPPENIGALVGRIVEEHEQNT